MRVGFSIWWINHSVRYHVSLNILTKICAKGCISTRHPPVMAIYTARQSVVKNTEILLGYSIVNNPILIINLELWREAKTTFYIEVNDM